MSDIDEWSDSEEWECLVCGYLNPPAAPACACGASRQEEANVVEQPNDGIAGMALTASRLAPSSPLMEGDEQADAEAARQASEQVVKPVVEAPPLHQQQAPPLQRKWQPKWWQMHRLASTRQLRQPRLS